MREEKRIYVIVAETVQAEGGPLVIQPVGRIAAQVGHVVSKMRVIHAVTKGENWSPITTIVLAARTSKEIRNLHGLLKLIKGGCEAFIDTNSDYNGQFHLNLAPDTSLMTAICTYPIEPSRTVGFIDHLPLWNGGRS